MGVAYFVRGAGESWAVIRLTGRDCEDIVAEGLSRDAAEELCFQKLEELPRDAVVVDGLPLDGDIAPGHQRGRQLTLKLRDHFPAPLKQGGVSVCGESVFDPRLPASCGSTLPTKLKQPILPQ